jgi:predicted class III extradiol MEMO1 family dioxygenase
MRGTHTLGLPLAGLTRALTLEACAYSMALQIETLNHRASKRVFILGPSHHYYLDGCALSRCKEYETPIGPLPLDLDSMRLPRVLYVRWY